jgi:hypothetical protein
MQDTIRKQTYGPATLLLSSLSIKSKSRSTYKRKKGKKEKKKRQERQEE